MLKKYYLSVSIFQIVKCLCRNSFETIYNDAKLCRFILHLIHDFITVMFKSKCKTVYKSHLLAVLLLH